MNFSSHRDHKVMGLLCCSVFFPDLCNFDNLRLQVDQNSSRKVLPNLNHMFHVLLAIRTHHYHFEQLLSFFFHIFLYCIWHTAVFSLIIV